MLVSHLYIAAIDVHTANHTALRGDICPVDHLFPVVKVQSHSIVQSLYVSRENDRYYVYKLLRNPNSLLTQSEMAQIQVDSLGLLLGYPE